MANDSFKIKKGLNIEPNTAPNLSTDGDIGFNSTDSNLEVYTGGSVKKVITNSQTQTLTNKTLTAPTIDVMTLDGQASAPANPSAGNYKVYVDDTTSKLQILDSSGTVTTVGTSAGGINYITNGDAEAATTGWATYADAAGTSPVDGTGGTANVTFTRSTSSPLRGLGSFLITKDAVNRQGQGASYAFTIADADKAKMMQIDFELEVNSGTYVTGDVAVYIYDVTNAAVIQPSGYQVENVGIESLQRLTFQTASNSTSYRLCFHVASVSALAYALKIDTITLGPQVVPLGAPVTDPVTFTPTGGWVSNATYTGKWWRVGKYAYYDVNIALSGAPSGTLTVNLFPGHTIDTAAMASSGTELTQLPGSSGGISDAGSRVASVMAYYNSSTSIIVVADNSTTAPGTVTATVPITFANTDSVNIKFEVPIVGWSSSTVVSSSADTRVVRTSLNRNTNQTGVNTNGTFVKVAVDTVLSDTIGGANLGSNRIEIRVPGQYTFTANTAVLGTNVIAASQHLLALYKNGTLYRNGPALYSLVSSGFYLAGNWTDNCVVGDYYELFFFGSANNSISTLTILGAASNTNFAATMSQGPSQIAASEVIAFQGTAPSNSISTSIIKVTGWTASLDTHASYNAANNRWICPAPGIYDLAVWLALQNTAVPSSVWIYINGIAVNGGKGQAYSNGSVYPVSNISLLRQLNSGDYIEIFAQAASSTSAIDAPSTSWKIQRLGGVM